MKKNGWTLIELMIAFSITLVVALLIFELTMNLKDLYSRAGYKTELLIKQANITETIYNDLTTKKITSLNECGTNCISFKFNDGVSKELEVNDELKTIKYGNYRVEFLKDCEFLEKTIKFYTNFNNIYNEKDSYFLIDIPINHFLYENEDFGLTLIYRYNSNENNLERIDF